MRIAFVLYPDMTGLDLVGPCELISRWPGASSEFIAATRDTVRCDSGLVLTPSMTFADSDAFDLVLVPGSGVIEAPTRDQRLLDWLIAADASATWMTSVCTGAGAYGKSGLTKGRRATTHWGYRPILAEMGVNVVAERVVFDDKYVSAAGVSAGIDMALQLTALVHGDAHAKGAQLAIEYDPQPPFDVGSLEKADPETVKAAIELLTGAPQSAAPAGASAGG